MKGSSVDQDWTIAHDFMFSLGGAERVTATLANYVLPKARLVIIAGRQEVVDELKLTEPTALYPFYWSSERVSAKCA